MWSMHTPIGAAQQTVTGGRLTLKKIHLDFLSNPTEVVLTYGPGRSLLMLTNETWLSIQKKLFGESGGMLTREQRLVEKRLVSNAALCEVDEKGRLRLPAPHLRRAMLEDKSVKAQLVPSPASGWIEIWNADEYDRVMDLEDDVFDAALDQVIRESRGVQSE